MYLQRLSVFFFFILMAHLAIAQTPHTSKVLTGVVLDKLSQKPIPMVEIRFAQEGKDILISTQSDGTFSINFTSERPTVLYLSHISYEPQRLPLEASATHVDVLLMPSTSILEDAIINAIRSNKNQPTTITNLNKKEIEALNFGQDLPLLLNQTPSTVVSSDAGAGVGYTGIRIRGIDPTRINVTINGIPLNDAESHGVYWVDLPDFASSAQSIQIQRGVGTSTNGTASFGSSINVKTDHVEAKPFASADLSVGSFNTFKTNARFGTGILSSGWGVQGRLSLIRSDGFIDRASSDLQSIFITAARYTEKDMLKFNLMVGHERTYQAWYGVPQPWFENKVNATHQFMDELYFTDQQKVELLSSNNNTYNPYTYKDEVDNYDQQHLQLFYNRKLKDNVHLNTGLHYTHGQGYYEQYRPADDFATYGLAPIQIGGDTISNGDFIRRRWLDNDFFGGIASAIIDWSKTQLIVGGGLHFYSGQHFGELIWAEYGTNILPGHRYYDLQANKVDGNLYAKWNREITPELHTYVDMQMRFVDYQFDNIIELNAPPKQNKASFTFFNPKVGLVYDWRKNHSANIFLGASQREPVRDDFVNGSANANPQPEQLYNLELGNQYTNGNHQVKFNYYAMYYRNQLVLTGAINDVGAYIRTNVPESYRLGVELEAATKPTKKLTLSGNVTLSQNKIIEFDEYVDDWFTGVQVVIPRKNSSLAFSPDYIAMVATSYDITPMFQAQLQAKGVGQQFLDNSQSDERRLKAFQVLNLQLNQKINLRKGAACDLGLQVNNLLNMRYAPNGYTFGTMEAEQRKSYNYVYPMAGRHFMLRLKITT